MGLVILSSLALSAQITSSISSKNIKAKVQKEHQQHSHVPKDIKYELCIETDEHIHTCTINTDVDIQSKVIDTETGNIKADELATIVASTNFKEVIEQLSLSKLINESYTREAKLNNQLNDLLTNTTNITSKGIFCGDQACAVSFTYKDTNTWNEFQHTFFSKNDTGNVFIQFMESNANEDLEVRMFFFPGNNAGVTERLNKS